MNRNGWIKNFLFFISFFFSPFFSFPQTANLQFRTLPRQPPTQHISVNRNDSSALVSVIPSPSSFMGGSVMGHHTIRRSTQSGLVEAVPTSMAGSFYPTARQNLQQPQALSINTSQHQQFYYGWQTMSPVTSALPSPVVPPSILKQSINYQKPPTVQENCDENSNKEKRDVTWVSFDLNDVCL